MSRRGALAACASLAIAGVTATERAFADEIASLDAQRVGSDRIWLKRLDGSEIISRFRRDDYDQAQILLLSWFMRDIHDRDKAVWIEPRLFDLLAKVQSSMSSVHGAPLPILVTSGYRTPAHNVQIEGAARNSMHLYGYAADIRVAGYGPRVTALAASFFRGGGIGIYDDFTHLDVWKTRVWDREGRRRGPLSGAAATTSN